MTETIKILENRFSKLNCHIKALSEYYNLIIKMETENNLYSSKVFLNLTITNRAVFDAYLKRFSSVQDYMGDKIFPLLSLLTGKSTSKMSEILLQMESEGVIPGYEVWIELREMRNALEHDYPEELEESLLALKKCVENYKVLVNCYNKALTFVKTLYKDFSFENIEKP